MKTVKELREDIQSLREQVLAIVKACEIEKRELSKEEQEAIDQIQGPEGDGGKVADLQKQLVRAEGIERIQKEMAAQRFGANVAAEPEQKQDSGINLNAIRIPAKAKAVGKLKAFNGKDAEKEAYIAGQFFRAVAGSKSANEWLDSHGIQNTMKTSDNTAGGYLVPDMLESAIIRNVEQFGIARRECRVVPMSGPVIKFPRLANSFTVYYAGENTAVTASDLTFDQVRLEARKPMIFTSWSSELGEDEVVALGDLIALEAARKFANAEDSALFLGDGTSTYGGIVGLPNVLAAGSIVTTATNIDTPAEITIASFEEAMGKLQRLDGIMPKWYCHPSFFFNCMARLAVAANGNNTVTYADGAELRFLGAPVVFVNAMEKVAPSTDISGDFFAYYGDLGVASTMGIRRGVEFAVDRSYGFNTDSVYFRATERYDINVHERGTATDGGAIIGLKANAS